MHLEGFRDPELVERIVARISHLANRLGESGERTAIMEVCGTHTMAIGRYGLRSLLPKSLRLLSGPGCPVCVTPRKEIDRAIEIGRRYGAILASFGDMFRVPGSDGSLEEARASGVEARIVYSPLDAVTAAKAQPNREVVFLGVGFETTSPVIAASLKTARDLGIRNVSVLPMMKTVPPALEAILSGGRAEIGGFLLPGHVCAITGTRPYEFIPERFGVPCVVAGFEPVDILQAILMLLQQRVDHRTEVEIAYRRVVSADGNPVARNLVDEVFTVCDSEWRAIGTIPGSGLTVISAYKDYDAREKFPVTISETKEPGGCICGKILMGRAVPAECSLFGVACTPERPVGPCMVSSEGTCAADYKYGINE
jgi:hydrogenase expression/formation protein HypD